MYSRVHYRCGAHRRRGMSGMMYSTLGSFRKIVNWGFEKSGIVCVGLISSARGKVHV